MSQRIIISSILISLLSMSSLAFAALTVTADIAKSLTENEQATATITVSNTAGSSTETSIVTELSSSPSWFSVVTACSTIPSLSAGASQTSTCIIKPTSTGSGLSITATATSQGGTSASGSASGINVASQSSSLTASITSSSSVSTGETFYLGVTVTAPSASDVSNARATISESGQCTVDTSYVAAQQSLGNITKGTSKSSLNWKITASSSSGTCSVTVNVVSDAGGSASPSKSITVTGSSSSDSSSSSSSGGGAGGAGGGGSSSTSKVTLSNNDKSAIVTIPSIAAKSEANILIKSSAIAVTQIRIKATSTVSNVQIDINRLGGIPNFVLSEAPGIISQYIEIRSNASMAASDVEKATISFNVDKSWIAENNINESSISLYRYSNDMWDRLETSKVSEDATKINYQAVTSGFSIFAISGYIRGDAPVVPATEGGAEKQNQTETGGEGISSLGKDSWKIVFIVVASLIAVGAVIYFSHFKSKTVKRKKQKFYQK